VDFGVLEEDYSPERASKCPNFSFLKKNGKIFLGNSTNC
jgi:hypothetical protein